MAGEWRATTLGEAVSFVSGGTPSKDEPANWIGDIPWVSAKDMKSFYLSDTEDHISESAAKRPTKIVPARTVLILTRGMTLLNDVPICVVLKPMTFNQDVKAVLPKPGVISEYIPYLLLSNKAALLNMVDLAGHGTGRLNSEELKSMPVSLPSEDEQRRLATFFAAIDNKIELNRKMSETLEATARTLFKSWFVDFDPVRAKVAGRATALPKHIDELFPDSFGESELGEIPEGWSICRVDDVAEVVGGSTPSTTQPEHWEAARHAWATPKDLAALRTPVLLKTERQISDSGLDQIGSGLLPAGTVLMSSRAPIGYIAISEIPVAINQGFIAMKPRHGVPGVFLRLWATLSQDDILSRANGSTFLEISKANFRPIRLVRPPDSVFSVFSRLAQTLHDRIVQGERQIALLSRTRDTLMPVLMAGG